MECTDEQIRESFERYQAGPELLELYNRLDLSLGEYVGAAVKDAYYSGFRSAMALNRQEKNRKC